MHDTPTLTLMDVALAYAEERFLSYGARHQYLSTVRSIERHAARTLKPGDLEDRMVNVWLAEQRRSGLAAATAHTRRRHLLVLWRYAVNRGLADAGPKNVAVVRLERRPPRAWRIEQVRHLLRVSGTLLGEFSWGIERATYAELFIRLAWDTGLRRHDLLSVRKSMVSPSGTVSLIQHKTLRSHVVGLNPRTRGIIEALDPPRDRPLLYWGRSYESWQSLWTNLVKFAGLKAVGQNPLRKSGASNVEADRPGMAPRYLGHAYVDSSLAARCYVDPTIARRAVVVPTEL